MNLDLLKNWKIWILIVLLVFAIFSISPNFSPRGFEVVSKNGNSTIPLSVGDVIYSINGNDVVLEDFTKNYSGIVSLSTNAGDKLASFNGRLGIDVKPVSTTKLKFGLDIEGG